MEMKVFGREALSDTVVVVVGTRPGIVMFAPIIHEFRRRSAKLVVVHTGQHYSPNMDAQFFEDLALPAPDFKLEEVAEKKTHGGQTAAMLEGIEQVLLRTKPGVVLVGGDANTNLAGALAARKLGVNLGHVEAGERSYDWRMPEEHNRRMIDHISDYLFTTGEKGKRQLERESVEGRIFVTGNPIVDASLQHTRIARERSTVLEHLTLTPGAFVVLTLHREENVDFPDPLKGALEGAARAGERLGMPVLFLMHPRTRKRVREFGLDEWVASRPALRLHDGLRYVDFLNVLSNAALALTDSGGVQQEACIHHVPAVTLRQNTEWVETLEHGANRLGGTDPEQIVAAAEAAVASPREWPIPFGDGTAAAQIVDITLETLPESRG